MQSRKRIVGVARVWNKKCMLATQQLTLALNINDSCTRGGESWWMEIKGHNNLWSFCLTVKSCGVGFVSYLQSARFHLSSLALDAAVSLCARASSSWSLSLSTDTSSIVVLAIIVSFYKEAEKLNILCPWIFQMQVQCPKYFTEWDIQDSSRHWNKSATAIMIINIL